MRVFCYNYYCFNDLFQFFSKEISAMSMTKNHIGVLQDRAAAGDREAIATLSDAGLWETVEQHDARAEWEEANQADETDFDEKFSDREIEFDDPFADAEALTSANFGTDEDYGCFGGDEF